MNRRVVLLFCILFFGFAHKNTTTVYDQVYVLLKKNYPLFPFRPYFHLDQAYHTYKKEALGSSSDSALFACTCKMLKGLEDFHVRLYSEGDRCYALSGTEWHRSFPSDSLQKVFWENSDHTLYAAGFDPIKSRFYDDGDPMIRYSTSKDLAYLHITRFEFKFGKTLLRNDSVKIADLLDSLVQEFKSAKALVIDVRSCQGGDTEIGEYISGRFTEERKQYATSVTFENNHDSLPPLHHFIAPKGKEQLPLPILLLTNQVSRSAAEWFVLMIRELPNVCLLGEPTWGAFADSETKKLKNGWELQYSIEKVYASDGQSYEGRGIPVDFTLKNGWDDITNKKDKVILKALDMAQNR